MAEQTVIPGTNVLEVRNLNKKYPSFELRDVSFTIKPGQITGFIGRNGAGKSTTLNSIFNMIPRDSGDISYFGLDLKTHERDIKQRVGFVSSGISYYPRKTIKTIASVTSSFFNTWDNAAYIKYMDMFGLDEKKTPQQLSSGMRVKFALAMALSHRAEFLMLDEPTSGLDPVSRDEILDVFMDLCDEGKSILFSTHITSDLDKCADNIIYMKNGVIMAETDEAEFRGRYRLAKFDVSELKDEFRPYLIGMKRGKRCYTALVKTQNADRVGLDMFDPDLEDVMIHLEKEDSHA